jgi:hypothetical protein
MQELNKMEDPKRSDYAPPTPVKDELFYPLNGMYYAAFKIDPRYPLLTVDYVGQIIAKIENTNYYLISKYGDSQLANYLHCSIVDLDQLKFFKLYQTIAQFGVAMKTESF